MLRLPRTRFCWGMLTAAIAFMAMAKAWAWPRDKEIKQLEVNLRTVMSDPGVYLNRTIRFRCRFAMMGNLFKHLNAPFNNVEYVNFAVWPLEAKLWERDDRKAVLPTLYLNKTALPEMAILRDCRRYDVLWLTGEVVSVYAGLPWVRVQKVEKDKEEGEGVNDAAIAHLSEGMALLAQNQPALAAKHLEMALAAPIPQRHMGFVFGQLAAARIKAGDLAGGVNAYEEALKRQPDDIELLLAYSRALLLVGRPQAALDNVLRVIAADGEKAEAYGLAAEAYAKLGQLRKGLEQCDLAASLAGNNAEDRAMAEVHRARVLAQGRRYADAVRVYAAVVQDTPLAEAPWLHKEIGSLYESRFDETGDVRFLEEADRQYRKASIFAGNSDAEAMTMVARAICKKAKAEKGEFAEAKQWLEKAKAVDPRYLPARLMCAEVALAEDNAEEARAIISEALADEGESAEALVAMADLYEKVGKLGDARDLLGRVAAQQPANRQIIERHIALCERTGDLAGARRSYEALAALAPGDADIAIKLANMYLQAGAAAEAEAVLAQASRSAQKSTLQAQINNLLGMARLWQGNERGAEAAWRAALAAEPQNAEAMARLAILLADANRRPAEALALAQRAHSLAPANPLGADALAAAKIRTGKPAEALVVLQRISGEQMSASAWYHLGMARLATGDRDSACDALTQAIAVGEHEVGAAAVVAKARALLQQITSEPPAQPAQPSKPVAEPAPAPEAQSQEQPQVEPGAPPADEEKQEAEPAAPPAEEKEKEAEPEQEEKVSAMQGEAGTRNTVEVNNVPSLRSAEVAPEMTVDAEDLPATQPPADGVSAVPAGKQILPREVAADTLERLARIEAKASSAPSTAPKAAPVTPAETADSADEEIADLPDWAK